METAQRKVSSDWAAREPGPGHGPEGRQDSHLSDPFRIGPSSLIRLASEIEIGRRPQSSKGRIWSRRTPVTRIVTGMMISSAAVVAAPHPSRQRLSQTVRRLLHCIVQIGAPRQGLRQIRKSNMEPFPSSSRRKRAGYVAVNITAQCYPLSKCGVPGGNVSHFWGRASP
jgi:hypothetical protein